MINTNNAIKTPYTHSMMFFSISLVRVIRKKGTDKKELILSLCTFISLRQSSFVFIVIVLRSRPTVQLLSPPVIVLYEICLDLLCITENRFQIQRGFLLICFFLGAIMKNSKCNNKPPTRSRRTSVMKFFIGAALRQM